jgi:prepilin signal peptidase PulO-like enzyme (type II secretory pathway)
MAGAFFIHAARSSAVPVVASALLGLGIPLSIRALIPGGIGWGDVKLSLALFLLLGPAHGLIALIVACLIALGGVGVAVVLEGFSLSRDAGLPFGPSMIAGALVSVTMEISI